MKNVSKRWPDCVHVQSFYRSCTAQSTFFLRPTTFSCHSSTVLDDLHPPVLRTRTVLLGERWVNANERWQSAARTVGLYGLYEDAWGTFGGGGGRSLVFQRPSCACLRSHPDPPDLSFDLQCYFSFCHYLWTLNELYPERCSVTGPQTCTFAYKCWIQCYIWRYNVKILGAEESTLITCNLYNMLKRCVKHLPY